MCITVFLCVVSSVVRGLLWVLARHTRRLACSAMQRRSGGNKRRQRDDEEEERPRKRGKEEADEDDDIFGYGATDPARGEAWTEEQDLRVCWLRCGWWILVLDI